MSLALAGSLLLAGCSDSQGEGRTIVASIYPLAFAAQRSAGPEWEVIDLTPPGVEAHDVELSIEQRSDIQDADMVLYLGDIGFQPQVERAVDEAEGKVIDLSGDLRTRDGVIDPHFWLEPSSFSTIVSAIQQELCPIDEPCSADEHSRREAFKAEIGELGRRYVDGLMSCRLDTMIVSHEAFGYLEVFGLRQFGLAGLTPEGEPSVDRLVEARRLVEAGQAGALFYEARGEDPDANDTLAADLGIPALPLDTLESQPPEGDYFTVMQDNLESLREGLGCR